ncbi:MAG: CARDB domain-containing protein [Deltaproteobacteria bacterium]|jgi:hypothetical protein
MSRLIHSSVFLLVFAVACGGPEEEQQESSEAISFTAQPAPPQAVAQPQPVGDPDLIVTNFNVTGPASLGCGTQTVFYTAIERNIGNGNAGRHFLHLQRQNPLNGAWIPTSSNQLGALAAGATRNLQGSFTFYNGPCDCPPTSYTINFRLFDDGGDLVAESNEGNNASNAVTVNATCP